MFIPILILLLSINPSELHQINTRRSYYSHPVIARLFENKAVFYFRKIEHQLFNYLDINKYLFVGHPRENE